LNINYVEKTLAVLVLCGAAATAFAAEEQAPAITLAESTVQAEAMKRSETSRSEAQKMLEQNQAHQQEIQKQLEQKQQQKMELVEEATASKAGGMMQKVQQNEMEQQQLQKTLMLKKQEELELRKLLEKSKQ